MWCVVNIFQFIRFWRCLLHVRVFFSVTFSGELHYGLRFYFEDYFRLFPIVGGLTNSSASVGGSQISKDWASGMTQMQRKKIYLGTTRWHQSPLIALNSNNQFPWPCIHKSFILSKRYELHMTKTPIIVQSLKVPYSLKKCSCIFLLKLAIKSGSRTRQRSRVWH